MWHTKLYDYISNINLLLKLNHIQKGLGWLLKYAYLTYPNEVEKYLRDNVDILSRTTFRYALEKMPKDLRNMMMHL